MKWTSNPILSSSFSWAIKSKSVIWCLFYFYSRMHLQLNDKLYVLPSGWKAALKLRPKDFYSLSVFTARSCGSTSTCRWRPSRNKSRRRHTKTSKRTESSSYRWGEMSYADTLHSTHDQTSWTHSSINMWFSCSTILSFSLAAIRLLSLESWRWGKYWSTSSSLLKY